MGFASAAEPCAASFDAPLEAVIRKLELRRLGGPQTGVRAIGRFSHQPCRRCGAVDWETRPAFAAGRYEGSVIPPMFHHSAEAVAASAGRLANSDGLTLDMDHEVVLPVLFSRESSPVLSAADLYLQAWPGAPKPNF